ncbi:hypothetical protein [Streptomyces sp. TP-A0874]|uniref:hypothetical protein n=1 Tax=Streptomyces sp. TP-A0874 TaxID=549819 RepID=UPI00147DD434|nr:hypothetical protein [Streptomyces sp. TP-A0874]
MAGLLEVLVWWTLLTGLWLVLISRVEPLEIVVGGSVALLCSVAARAARRAVTHR